MKDQIIGPGIYEHLLTCSRRAAIVDTVNDTAMKFWQDCHGIAGPPILSGANPRVNNSHVALWLASSNEFSQRYLSAERQVQFKRIVDEARLSLINACKSHPIINQVRSRAMGLGDLENIPEGMVDEDLDADEDEDADEDDDNREP
jgi:hypothetical protein